MTLQILAPHFVAAVVLEDGEVVQCAPILKWVQYRKLTMSKIRAYCNRKGWEIIIVE